MTPERIKTIIYQKLKSNPTFGAFEISKDEHAPMESPRECIVITNPGGMSEGKIKKAYVHVSIYVPDKEVAYKGKTYLTPDNARLETLEIICEEMFKSLQYGEYGSYSYWFTKEKMTTEKDETKCHFLNVRLLFEITNF